MRLTSDRALAAAIGLLGLAAGAGLLYAPYCQFTGLKLQLHDYGIYTNFLWNSAHGHLFRYLLNESYLTTHLSFSALLLTPFFHIWDHPFLLTLLQWACGVLGALGIGWVAARLRIGGPAVAAFMLLQLAYPYTQRVLLCEFHGVALYFILLPWLYLTLTWRRGWVWLPLTLLLGLREDAALVALPMVLYVAVSTRWKGGYVYAAITVLYGVLAMAVLFPAINTISLDERRAPLMNAASILDSFHLAGLRGRGRALFWLFVPAALLLRRGWRSIVVFPSLPLLVLLASPYKHHFALGRHYSAAIFTLLVLGLLEAIRRNPPPPRAGRLLALYLTATIVAAHLLWGCLPGGGDTRDIFRKPREEGRAALRAAAHIPKDGILLTDKFLCQVSANRADLVTFDTWRDKPCTPDSVFFTLNQLLSFRRHTLTKMLTNGVYGVIYFDHTYTIIARGAATNRNAEVLMAAANTARTLPLAHTRAHAGRAVETPGAVLARYWPGREQHGPAVIVEGAGVKLDRGAYRAWFRFRAEAPVDADGPWGQLAVRAAGDPTPLVSAPIEPRAGPPGEFRYQTLRFELPEPTAVEPRVTGAAAPLWIDRVLFVPEAPHP